MPEQVFEHKGLGIRLALREFTQGLFEAYVAELAGSEALSMAAYRGAMVRAAVKVGWIVEPAWTPEQIGELSPAVVRWAAGKLDAAYGAATVIPPE